MIDRDAQGLFLCSTYACRLSPEACVARQVARGKHGAPAYRRCRVCAQGTEAAKVAKAPGELPQRQATGPYLRSGGPLCRKCGHPTSVKGRPHADPLLYGICRRCRDEILAATASAAAELNARTEQEIQAKLKGLHPGVTRQQIIEATLAAGGGLPPGVELPPPRVEPRRPAAPREAPRKPQERPEPATVPVAPPAAKKPLQAPRRRPRGVPAWSTTPSPLDALAQREVIRAVVRHEVQRVIAGLILVLEREDP